MRGHVVGAEAEAGYPVQQRHSAVGQQGPVAVSEPVQRVTSRGQVRDLYARPEGVHLRATAWLVTATRPATVA
ncbi:hypothetical protein J1792_25115 [Streptomyces triculaminicus]|uniref:Uncharacterized protein n=2 Tax=Streptomyces TaxID=1883 RepID=A0A939JP23_9ACTN|nr:MULTISPECIES: hypothetical protein [Streptomyces]MBO0655931.1 hypothetical protein [Streptomyces triculaminicus]QSY49931.1 hypothetical protein J3S04_02280 [Streptomyces griseocarneus]